MIDDLKVSLYVFFFKYIGYGNDWFFDGIYFGYYKDIKVLIVVNFEEDIDVVREFRGVFIKVIFLKIWKEE